MKSFLIIVCLFLSACSSTPKTFTSMNFHNCKDLGYDSRSHLNAYLCEDGGSEDIYDCDETSNGFQCDVLK
jgi:starvation-inducible outer membrane lipoprotein